MKIVKLNLLTLCLFITWLGLACTVTPEKEYSDLAKLNRDTLNLMLAEKQSCPDVILEPIVVQSACPNIKIEPIVIERKVACDIKSISQLKQMLEWEPNPEALPLTTLRESLGWIHTARGLIQTLEEEYVKCQ